MNTARATVAAPVRVEGVGLFTSEASAVTIEPAIPERPDAPAGIVFAIGDAIIPATIAYLSATPAHAAFAELPGRNSAIEAHGLVVHTVEHLLAALVGLGITDALVRIEGGEIPIGDGSADLFVRPILDAGLRPLTRAEPATPIRVRTPIRAERDGASVTIEPSDHPEFVYRLDYGAASPIPPGEATWMGGPDEFARTIAPARTFCLESEAQAMHAMGLFAHLTPRDMLVFGHGGPIDNEMRFADEPARHKLLDLIGDLSLAGRPICARVVAERSGHALNHEAARRLVALVEA